MTEHAPGLFSAHLPQRPSRLRRFFLRHLPLSIAGLTLLLIVAVVGAYFYASSGQFQNTVRKQLITTLQQTTGGRVELASFHWRLLALQADAEGLVIHGSEGPNEAPYARIERMSIQLSLLNLLSPRMELRSLDIVQPSLHLIVYQDGSTNQPQPRHPRKSGTPFLQTLFNAHVGRVSVEQGMLDYDNRAAAFDVQNRYLPLDFSARDVALRMIYVPRRAAAPESYRIEAGVSDLDLTRGGQHSVAEPGHGRLQATVDLQRNAVYLHFLRLTASSHKNPDHTLEITGSLEDFAHPQWQARATGDFEMGLLNVLTGYPFTPQGIAHLNLDAAGHASVFRIDGTAHIDDGSFIGVGVVATGFRVDAHIHADPERLLVSSIVAHLRQGGQVEGTVDLSPWLPTLPGASTLQSASAAPLHSSVRSSTSRRSAVIVHPPPAVIPVNGKVTAKFEGPSVDTILDMVSPQPFQRLGFDSLVSGQATANWTNGDVRTLVVNANLNLNPSAQPPAGEVPASGVVDATYTQRTGSVDLRTLQVNLPGSQLRSHGQLGAFPLTSASSLAVDFHSRKLAEFDTVLRDLGLQHNGKAGVAALPLSLTGQADFNGTWGGSILDPRISGTLNASQLDFELPGKENPNAPQAPVQPRFVHVDTVQAAGSYSATRIVMDQCTVQRGDATLSLGGTLDASPALTTPAGRHATAGHSPVYDANSTLHMHLQAAKVDLGALQPFLDFNLPATGTADAQLQIDGPLRDLGGSGSVALQNGSINGQSVASLRAQGALANNVLTLSSIAASTAGGSLSGHGSYDLHSRRFTVDATGKGIDLARIEQVHQREPDAAGKLSFTVAGGGTFSDPRLQAHAMLSGLALSGQSLGQLELTAHSVNGAVTYDAATRMDGASWKLHGQTSLASGYATQAQLSFLRLDIGTLLKLAHVQGLDGQSSLAGTVTVSGPLANPEQLRGEASLQDLALTVEGVHLKSDSGLHATLDGGRIHLDPLHITGEDTNIHANGSLALQGDRRLDLAASGSINLKLAETLDPDLSASGTTTFQVEAHGPLSNPGLQGRIDLQDGALSLGDVPNGLSQLHGTLVFNQNRLEVKTLTAMTGGGLLTVGGFLSYQNGIYANLAVSGKAIRIRYPSGVSSLADATLRVQGPQNNLFLSGNVLITRFSISPNLDIAALAAQTNAVTAVAPPDAPSNHIRLDVHIASSPQLNFQNAFAKLAGDVDLRLRGTVATPSLLGSISITEGSAMIAGTRYDLQRGDITFNNPVRIEPTIDINATAHVEDYDITLGLHGTASKPTVTYRSDPPLPEADVVALLALGHTENQQRLYTQQQEAAFTNPTTDALLGGALNATVSSRVQKLFGAGSVKVDPNYLGAFGNSTSRITVNEQLGRNVTLTYATNVNTTGQQLLQAEIAINRHVSLLVARDESGVFSMVIKATRRYR